MKRLTAPALLTLISITLAACGGGGSSPTTTHDTHPTQTAFV